MEGKKEEQKSGISKSIRDPVKSTADVPFLCRLASPPVGGFYYITTLAGSRGSHDGKGNFSREGVAERTEVIVTSLPALPVPASVGYHLDAIVSFIDDDTGEIYLQLKNMTEEIVSLSKHMQEAYGTGEHKVLVNPFKGQACSTKYSIDQQWYRACVVDRPNPVSVKVHFVDYGNVELVDKGNIRELSPEYLSFPPMAVRVVISGMPANDVLGRIERLRALIDGREVSLKIESNTGKCFVGSIYVANRPLIGMLMADGRSSPVRHMPLVSNAKEPSPNKAGGLDGMIAPTVAFPPASLKPEPAEAKTPPVRKDGVDTEMLVTLDPVSPGGGCFATSENESMKKIAERGFSQEESNAAAPSSPQVPMEPVTRLPMIPEQPVTDSRNAMNSEYRQEENVPTKEILKQPERSAGSSIVVHKYDKEEALMVVVSELKSPRRFYVTPVDPSKTHMGKIHDLIEMEPKVVMEDQKEGKCCLAEWQGSWFRGELKRKNSSGKWIILFVDYGNEDDYAPEKIFAIQNRELLEIPRQASKCWIAGVSPVDKKWSDEAIDYLSKLLKVHEEEKVEVKAIFRDLDPSYGYRVNLFLEDKSVAELLVENGHARAGKTKKYSEETLELRIPDDDGDYVVFSTDEELRVAIDSNGQSSHNTLKIYVKQREIPVTRRIPTPLDCGSLSPRPSVDRSHRNGEGSSRLSRTPHSPVHRSHSSRDC